MRKEERENIIEELAMVLCHIDGLYWNDLTLTEASDYKKKTELVCLKVERELPDIETINIEGMGVRAGLRYLQSLYDGYVATVPLI